MRLIYSGLIAAILMGASMTGASAACVVDVASWDVLWIRSGPSTGYEKVGSIPHDGCGVRVFWSSCRGPWCRVRYRGVEGWAHTRYLN